MSEQSSNGDKIIGLPTKIPGLFNIYMLTLTLINIAIAVLFAVIFVQLRSLVDEFRDPDDSENETVYFKLEEIAGSLSTLATRVTEVTWALKHAGGGIGSVTQELETINGILEGYVSSIRSAS